MLPPIERLSGRHSIGASYTPSRTGSLNAARKRLRQPERAQRIIGTGLRQRSSERDGPDAGDRRPQPRRGRDGLPPENSPYYDRFRWPISGRKVSRPYFLTPPTRNTAGLSWAVPPTVGVSSATGDHAVGWRLRQGKAALTAGSAIYAQEPRK